MNRISKFIGLSTISAVLFSTGAAFAQDHRDDHRNDNRDQYHDNGSRNDNGYRNNDRNNDRRDWNDRDHDHYVRHNDWRRGNRLPPDYWQHARRVDDYRVYHLRRPPRGYEWRQVDGNYVMAAVATGIIASVIAGNVGR